MITSRYSHTMILLASDKVLVAGGYNFSGYLSNAEIYDPDAETWTTISAMNITCASHTATLLPNGKISVAGGFNTSSSGSLANAELCGLDFFTITLNVSGQGAITGIFSNYPANTNADLTATGKIYRIEDSLDVEAWSTVESGIVGGGTYTQRFHTTRNLPKRYFRVEEETP